MMGEEKKIAVEEVDKVETPPRARVTPETASETFERKRDYLAGFLAEQPKDEPATNNELVDAVIEALKSIYDPEIPVDEGHVLVTMTLTTPHCPVAESMPGEVELRVLSVPGIRDAEVKLVWDPPWDPSKMSDEARLELGML